MSTYVESTRLGRNSSCPFLEGATAVSSARVDLALLLVVLIRNRRWDRGRAFGWGK
jgi:hypothetical protein